jgi:hypothetical protein
MIKEFNNIHHCIMLCFDENSNKTLEHYVDHPQMFKPVINSNTNSANIHRQVLIHNILNNSSCSFLLIHLDDSLNLYQLLSDFNIMYGGFTLVIISKSPAGTRSSYMRYLAWASLVINVSNNHEYITKNRNN